MPQLSATGYRKTGRVQCGVRKSQERARCCLSNYLDGKTDPVVACYEEHVLAIWEIVRCCVVHVLQRVLSQGAVGVKLFPFNGAGFRRVLCRLLTLLGHNDASQVTLKSFRAGCATSLAASEHSIDEILIAGEWKSSAFLKYRVAGWPWAPEISSRLFVLRSGHPDFSFPLNCRIKWGESPEVREKNIKFRAFFGQQCPLVSNLL